MQLSLLFLHMLTLKALAKLNVTDRWSSELNVSMNQYHKSICNIHQLCEWVRNNDGSVYELQLIIGSKSFIKINWLTDERVNFETYS